MIRICQTHRCPLEEETRWWNELTQTMQQDLKQLIKHKSLIKEIDRLAHIPGLWSLIKIGTLRRIATLNCHEVRSICW